MPEVVTRLIHAVLGELNGKPPPGRAVEPGEKPFHDTLGHHLDPAELRDLERVEEVEAGPAGEHGGR